MNNQIKLLFILPLVFLADSCGNVLGTEFWEGYQSALIVESKSDQGPNGGYISVYWKSKIPGTFNSKDMIKFATENGWALQGTETFDSEEIEKWKYLGKPIFPLSSSGFTLNIENNSTFDKFPRYINSEIKVYKFRTKFITIESGTDNSIDENGFVIINRNGTQMSVYNFWGE